MKHIFFHIGTPKTGTTALQTLLHNNAEQLRAHDVHVTSRVLLNEAQLMLQDRMDAGIDNARAVGDIFARELACPQQTLIMSHEAYAGVSYLHDNSIAEHYARYLAELLQGHRVTIVVYLRRQDLFMESRYIQSIKSGLTVSFAEYLDLHGGNQNDWWHLTEAYARKFGRENLVVRPFERDQLKDRDVVRDFMDVVGLGDVDFPGAGSETLAPAQRNAAYSRDALVVQRIYNRQFYLEEAKRTPRLEQLARSLSQEVRSTKAVYRRAHQALARGVDPDVPRRPEIRQVLQRASSPCMAKPLLFTPEARQRYLERHADSNAQVAQTYLGRSKLFSDSVPKGEVVSETKAELENVILAYGNALADQFAEIEALKARIKALEALVESLKP